MVSGPVVGGLLSAAQPELLVHYFDLAIDHLVGEAVNRHMYPVMWFAFNDEIVLQIGRH